MIGKLFEKIKNSFPKGDNSDKISSFESTNMAAVTSKLM